MGEQQCQPARTSGSLGDWTTNQRVHIEETVALAAYVAEDGLGEHQSEEWPLGLKMFGAPV